MDAQRTSFLLIFAALFAGTALAEPPSLSAPIQRAANDWSSAAPTSAPTISASPGDRYGNSRYSYPQNTQPPSITQRVQNGVSETTNSLRSGVDSSVRAAGQQFSTAATSASQQAFGTAGYPSQNTNPFATQPAAPPASATTRNLAPPPWPSGTGTPAPPATPSWDSSTPVTPVDRSVLANPAAPPTTGNSWTSISSTVAAPPLLTPQLPTSTSSLTPLNTTQFDNGPTLTTDSYRGGQSSSSASTSWAQQSTSPSTARSTSPADDWATAWGASANNNNVNNNGASISRTANNSSPSGSNREPEFPSSQRANSNTPDVRSTVAKPADSWIDDSWSRNSQASPSGVGTSIGGSKTAAIGSAVNTAPQNQAPAGSTPFNPASIGPSGGNVNPSGLNPNASQQPLAVNAAKPTTATGEPQPWVTLLAAILGLAGSLAGNIYLGWSYLDARQKYQALVRRTADTFRRTKVAA